MFMVEAITPGHEIIERDSCRSLIIEKNAASKITPLLCIYALLPLMKENAILNIRKMYPKYAIGSEADNTGTVKPHGEEGRRELSLR